MILELDERRGEGGLRVRLMYWDGDNGLADPQTHVEVWEAYESTQADLVIPVASQDALDAFWHPYAYAPRGD